MSPRLYLRFVSFAHINANLKYENTNPITSWNQALTFRYNNTKLPIQEFTLLVPLSSVMSLLELVPAI